MFNNRCLENLVIFCLRSIIYILVSRSLLWYHNIIICWPKAKYKLFYFAFSCFYKHHDLQQLEGEKGLLSAVLVAVCHWGKSGWQSRRREYSRDHGNMILHGLYSFFHCITQDQLQRMILSTVGLMLLHQLTSNISPHMPSVLYHLDNWTIGLSCYKVILDFALLITKKTG